MFCAPLYRKKTMGSATFFICVFSRDNIRKLKQVAGNGNVAKQNVWGR